MRQCTGPARYQPSSPERTFKQFNKNIVLYPIDCQSARGTSPNDYFKDDKGEFGVVNMCWMNSEVFRRLYREYDDMTDGHLSHKLYSAAGFPQPPPPEPWHYVGILALIGIGIPGVVLLVGVALLWALSGFKQA